MNKKPFLKTLEYIVSDSESFDTDITDLILNKITTEISSIFYSNYYYSSNFTLSGSLWARVCFDSLIRDDFDNLESWKNLLNKYSPESISNDKNIVKLHSMDEFNNSFFPVSASSECLNLALRGHLVFDKTNVKEFTQEEEIMIIVHNLQTIYGDINYSKIKEDIPYCDYLVGLLIKNREKINQTFELKEGEFLTKVLNSATFKEVLSNISPVKFLDLISDNDLRVIHKTASLQKNIENNPKMLNNFLTLAAPEKWLDSHRNKNSYFNILKFFENKFFLSTGKKINKINHDKEKKYTYKGKVDNRGNRKETGREDYSVGREMLEEFRYLAPALKEQNIENDIIIQWYRAIIRAEAMDLFKLSSSVISIPSKDSVNIDNKEYELLNQELKYSKWDNELKGNVYYHEIYAQGQSQKLAENLQKNLQKIPVISENTKVKI